MADISLSDARREDWEPVRPLAASLEASGWSVWWDRWMRAGLHFDAMIEGESAARWVRVVWTEVSVRSHSAVAAEAGSVGGRLVVAGDALGCAHFLPFEVHSSGASDVR